MAWLQSSFTSHQLLGDSSSSHKKPFKSSAVNKSSDPDKSDTPLLCGSAHSPENETASSGWLKSTCNNSEKKQNLLSNSSKSSFLPHGFFDKSLGNSKGRMHVTQNSPGASGNGKKPENAKLLSDENNKKHPLFDDNNDEDDDNDEEDSDDGWCAPRLGVYQKVRPCAE